MRVLYLLFVASLCIADILVPLPLTPADVTHCFNCTSTISSHIQVGVTCYLYHNGVCAEQSYNNVSTTCIDSDYADSVFNNFTGYGSQCDLRIYNMVWANQSEDSGCKTSNNIITCTGTTTSEASTYSLNLTLLVVLQMFIFLTKV
jgi:hypothetical protein